MMDEEPEATKPQGGKTEAGECCGIGGLSHEHRAGRDPHGEAHWGGFCPIGSGDLQFRGFPLLMTWRSLGWPQAGRQHQERCNPSSSHFQAPLKGTRRLRRAQQTTRYPSPSCYGAWGEAAGISPGLSATLGHQPPFPPPIEQEATARDTWWLPPVSLLRGYLSL